MSHFWRTLKDWGRVVSSIEYSARQQTLDSRENDLIWLLRSDNPRFRDAALKALRHLRYRSDRLLSELVRIIEDDAAGSHTRIAAACGFGHLVSRQQWPAGLGRTLNRTLAARLRAMLDKDNPPDLEQAVRNALAEAEECEAEECAGSRGQ